MKKKNYKILLCEDLYQDGNFINTPVCEIGSSSSDFAGQAFNIEFYSKIDGTHELSFKLPQFYFDVDTGKMMSNELVELLVNKCKIELQIEDKTYFMVINSRTDKENGNQPISYEYKCTDIFIEELSKTGYGLIFSDEVEGNGLGTIHEFAAQIAEGTDWEYMPDETGTLYEYKKEFTYNIDQARYDEVHIPIPVHKVKYIPELKRYCNELKVFMKKEYCLLGDVDTDGIINKVDLDIMTDPDFDDVADVSKRFLADMDENGEYTGYDQRKLLVEAEKLGITNSSVYWELNSEQMKKYRKNFLRDDSRYNYLPCYHRIYCYEDSEQITSNTVQNYISNADDFVDYIGWQTYIENEGDISHGLVLGSEKVGENYLLTISSNGEQKTTYLLNDTIAASNKSIQGNAPYAFTWTNGSPTPESSGKITKILIYGKNPLSNPGIQPDYVLATDDGVFKSKTYYTIKPKTSIFNPYIVFEVDCINGTFSAESFSFFPIKGKNTDDKDENSSEKNNLELLANLTDGDIIEEDKQKIMQLPADVISTYTHKQVRYFIRNNYLVNDDQTETQIIINGGPDTVTYLDFDNVNSGSNFTYSEGEFSKFEPIYVESTGVLPETGDSNKIYKLSTDGKYYQYYTISIGEQSNGAWDYALYDEGDNDKRRTLSAERSNRFNLIQELAELFRVWPVFNISRDSDGKIQKQFWFKENCIRENFSGFHKGVNLSSLSRTVDSDNIVTKMYVEDQETDLLEDGFVTIRKCPLNPWGENYYYNFQYYINQKLINVVVDDKPIVEKDLSELYSEVKTINNSIFDLNDKISNAKVELSNLNSRLISLATSIAAMVERTTSLEADLANYRDNIAEPDKNKLENSISNYSEQKKKYEKEKETTQEAYDKLKEEIEDWQSKLFALMSEKKDLINSFENKYSQYIKEGVWSDSSYVDNNTYYLDSLNVMATSSMPKIDWSIEVIDGSFSEELENFEFQVGDQTILVDDEFFMKDPTENYKFDVLVSGIKEYLDIPTKNVIEVRNYRTSFEDIFQRISAATQTLELNEQTYNKAAYFTSDGQVDQSIIQNTLLNNALILANATDNSYVLDNTGLHLQSIINPAKKLRAIADGIFISNSVNDKGEPKWMTGITADGINASVLTSGEVNTSVIKIYSKGTPSFSWNELGITAYKYKSGKVDSNAFMRFDSFGLYSVDDIDDSIKFNYDTDGKAWFEQHRNNRDNALKQIIDNALVSITDKGFNLNVKNGNGSIRLGYKTDDDGNFLSEYGLYIKDTSGNLVVQLQNDGVNQIAGWKIDKYTLTNYQETTQKDESGNILYRVFGMQTSDAPSSINALAIGLCKHPDGSWGDAAFRVTHDGKLYATGAEIEGKITVGEGAKIGGWEISNGDLSRTVEKGKKEYLVKMQAGEHVQEGTAAFLSRVREKKDDGSWQDWENTFYVTYGGYLNATKGNFSDSVTIGGTKVTAGYLRNLYDYATSGKNDGVTIKYVNAIGGTVGGWSINENSIQRIYKKGINEQGEIVLSAPTNNYPAVKVSFGRWSHASLTVFEDDSMGSTYAGLRLDVADGDSVYLFAEPTATGMKLMAGRPLSQAKVLAEW